MRARGVLSLGLFLAVTIGLLAPGFAVAASAGNADSTPPSTDQEQAASQAPVVRELVELRTVTSKTFLLADGTKRAVVFDVPVHYLDENGDWQEIDTTLVPVPQFPDLTQPWTLLDTTPDTYQSASTPVDVTITDETGAQSPITLEYKDYQIQFNMAGATEATKVVDGDEATYQDVARGTDVNYQVVAEGLKETIELSSAAAPNSFKYFVKHDGLDLRQDGTGQWGFYRPGGGTPVFELSDVLTFDSSSGAAGEPAYSDRADMTVSAADGGSYITYTVPRAWLSDPARVYPVKIDPSITLGQAVCDDTYINTAYPNTSYGSSTSLSAGTSTITLIKFALSGSLSSSDYITAAQLKMKRYSGSSTAWVNQMNEAWSGSSTYNSLNSGGINMFELDNFVEHTNSWLICSCAKLTQQWLNGEYTNYGFSVGGNTATNLYRSSEYGTSTDRPRLEVDYTNPTATVGADTARVYKRGDLAKVVVTVGDIGGAANIDKIQELRLGINRATGSSDDYGGVLAWTRGGVPDGSGNWSNSPYKVGGGYFSAYEADDGGYGERRITPQLDRCDFNGSTGVFTFYLRINESFPYSAKNRFSVNLTMRSPGAYWTTYVKQWANSGPSFSVQAPTTVGQTPTDWFTETTVADGTLCDVSSQGRGNVTLSWPKVKNADGYGIYLWDGTKYAKVGQTVAGRIGYSTTNGEILESGFWTNDANTWSSSGLRFAPKDLEVKNSGATWPTGSPAKNPFYRAQTPSAATLLATPAPSQLANSAGVVATDGTDIFVRNRRGRTDGQPRWQQYSGSTGSWLRTVDIATPDAPLTGFGYYRYLYSGTTFVDTPTAGKVSVKGVRSFDTTDLVNNPNTKLLTFDVRPLERDTGAAVSASQPSSTILLGAAPDDSELYSVSSTLTQSGGAPAYDGYRIRVYDLFGQNAVWSGTYSITMPSQTVSGVIVDETSIYLIGYTGGSDAVITRIDRSSMLVVSQWGIDQGSASPTAGACSGAYLPAQMAASGGVVWLGHLSANKLYKFAAAQGGVNLRDNPNALYKVNGTESVDWTHYSFRVVPYTGTDFEGCGPESFPGVLVTLDNRTKHVNELPIHPTADLSSFCGHAASARLDEKSLALSTTDLVIASWGPRVALDRVYLSSRPASVPTTRFAPGWRFSFERSLLDVATPANGQRYVDAAGNIATFTPAGSDKYKGPFGTYSWLARDTANNKWYLHLADRSILEFDASGRLTAEYDAAGNKAAYAWNGTTGLTITAANGQKLAIVFAADGRIFTATYQTWGSWTLPATRDVSYSSSTTAGSVVTQPGQSVRTRTRYEYTSGRLSGLIAEAPSGNDWIPAGQETFSYNTTSGALTGVALPESLAPCSPVNPKATIELSDTGTLREMKVTRHGKVAPPLGSGSGLNADGSKNYSLRIIGEPADADLDTTYSWNENGTVAKVTNPAGGVNSYLYSPDNQVATTISPANRVNSTAIDVRGNAIASSDGLGNGGVTVYPDYGVNDPLTTSLSVDLPQATIDAAGVTKFFSYDSCGYPWRVESEIKDREQRSFDVSRPPANQLVTGSSDRLRTTTTYGSWYLYADGTSYSTSTSGHGEERVLYHAVIQDETQPYHLATDPDADPADTGPTFVATGYGDFHISGQSRLRRAFCVKTDADNGYTTNIDTTSSYNGFGQLLTTTDGCGRVTATNTYDAAGRLISTSGPTTNRRRDPADATGLDCQVTLNSAYDSLGNVIDTYKTTSDTQMSGKKLDYVHRTVSPSGWLMSESHLDGLATNGGELWTVTYTYDGVGRQLTADGSKVCGKPARTDYDRLGNVLSSWSEGRPSYSFMAATRATYDADGLQLEEWQPGGDPELWKPWEPGTPSTTNTYRATDGRLLRQDDRAGSWATTLYDSAGRVVVQTTPMATYDATNKAFDTSVSTSRYDIRGNVIRAVDPSGTKTTYAYDALGRQIHQELLTPEPGDGSDKPDDGVTGLDNAETTTTYNNLGWVLKEDAVEDVSTWTDYNFDGTVAKHAEGDILTQNVYDARSGEQTTIKLGPTSNESTITRQTTVLRDVWGREIVKSGSHVGATTIASTVETTYDSQSRATHVVTKRGTKVIHDQTTEYFPVGSPTAIKHTDKYGRGVGRAAADPEQQLTVTTFEYPGRESESQPRSSFSASASVVASGDQGEAPYPTRGMTWVDFAGRISEVQLWIDCPSTQKIEGTTFGYDANDRLFKMGGTAFVAEPSQTYFYDDLTGDLKRRHLQFTPVAALKGDIDTSYTYDKSMRLKKAGAITYTYNGGASPTKFFDDQGTTGTGDDVTKVLTYTKRQRVTKIERNGAVWRTYGWDTTNGRRTSMECPDPDDDRVTSYTYNGDGTLKQAEEKKASNTAIHTATSTYSYDANGQRTQMAYEVGSSTLVVTDYTYDGLTLLSLYAATDNESWSICYVPDGDGVTRTGFYESVSGSTYVRRWFALVRDQRGDVVELLDKDGQRFASYRYNEWGEPLGSATRGTTAISPDVASAIASRQPLRYAGYVYDSVTGLYYAGARYYDPTSHQFISRDPIKADGAQSAYQYCNNNPVLAADPSGLKSNHDWWILTPEGRAKHARQEAAEARWRDTWNNDFSSLPAPTIAASTARAGAPRPSYKPLIFQAGGASAANVLAASLRYGGVGGTGALSLLSSPGGWTVAGVVLGLVEGTRYGMYRDDVAEWEKAQAATEAVAEVADDALGKANDMASELDEFARTRKRVIAVLVTNEATIVSGSGEKGLKGITVPAGDLVAGSGPRLHAEQNCLDLAEAMGYRPIALAASLPICPGPYAGARAWEGSCRERIEGSGGYLNSPWTAVWP